MIYGSASASIKAADTKERSILLNTFSKSKEIMRQAELEANTAFIAIPNEEHASCTSHTFYVTYMFFTHIFFTHMFFWIANT